MITRHQTFTEEHLARIDAIKEDNLYFLELFKGVSEKVTKLTLKKGMIKRGWIPRVTPIEFTM